MKNLIALSKSALIAICLLFIIPNTFYGQIGPILNYTKVKQTDGLVMQRVDHNGGSVGKCIMNFHSDANANHPDFIYLRATEEDNNNNLILNANGTLMVGGTDDCLNLTIPTPSAPEIGEAYGTGDIRLFVNGQIAVRSGASTSTIVSDQRLKKNINPLNNSLDVIRQTNFVEYNYNEASGIKSKEKYYGILAQEMQEVLPTTVKQVKSRLRTKDSHETEYLMFNPNNLIYSGLNAIKELDEENQALKDKVAKLEEKVEANEALEQRVADLEKLLLQMTGKETGSINARSQTPLQTTAYLSQNRPNPLNKSTVIDYQLPDNTSTAYITVQDLNGVIITKYDVQQSKGSITFDAERYGISNGTYLYSLVINGVVTTSQKMVFIK